MTTYTAIANTEIDAESPITDLLLTRFRDNPLAIAEGDATAPKVSALALSGMYVGYATLSGTTAASFTNLTRMETMRIAFNFTSLPNGGTIQFAFSDNNGSTYGSFLTALTNGSGAAIAGMCELQLNLRTGLVTGFAGETSSANTTLTVPTNCNAFLIRQNGSGTFSARVLVWCMGGRIA